MEKYINDYGKECYRDVEESTKFELLDFHFVPNPSYQDEYDKDIQYALHTNLGSLTVLNRRTGFGWRDVETGFRDPEGKFWLASGNLDVRESNSETIGDAILWVKSYANNCVGI